MNNMSPKLNPRESVLVGLLNKIIKEYKALLSYTRQSKPFKIVEIYQLSNTPGETAFLIQVTNKNYAFRATAAQIIQRNYNLSNFNDFHAEMIKRAAQGTLVEFLHQKSSYKIVSKRLDREIKQYVFTLETSENQYLTCTADEISKDKNILMNISKDDVYDVGYTQGSESIIKENKQMLIAKIKNIKNTIFNNMY